ncbi:hypothetical protein [Roseomonas elaeocarpi]|uniref:Heme exporter protein D n=1 Tax=Roseomonas elaeocarpi TaxID=907779 RepID=A0ABV6JTP0_9PROT
MSLHWWHVTWSWAAAAVVLGAVALSALHRQSAARRQLRLLEQQPEPGTAA